MKRNSREAATAVANGAFEDGENNQHNGTSLVEPASGDLSVILSGLQTMRDGDFSVRLPGSWIGLPGKIADTFNSIVAANQQMAQELKRVGPLWTSSLLIFQDFPLK